MTSIPYSLKRNFIYGKVTAVVNLDGGKIVTVQKAKKDGEKSTKVIAQIKLPF